MYSGQDQPPSYQPPVYTPPQQRVRFEDIGVAFQLLQKQLGAWVGASALIGLINAVLVGPLYGYYIYQSIQKPGAEQPLVSGLFSGLVTFVGLMGMAGLQKMALKQLRGESLSPTSFTGAFAKFGSLAVMALVLGVVSALISALPGFIPLLLIIPETLFTTLFTLAILLILDQDCAPLDALRKSARVISQEYWLVLAFSLVLGMAGSLGAIACGVGMLFTLPIIPLGVTVLYRNFYPERFNDGGGS